MRVELTEVPGKIHTNGEIYGRELTLADGMTAEGFYLITREEYEDMTAPKYNELEEI